MKTWTFGYGREAYHPPGCPRQGPTHPRSGLIYGTSEGVKAADKLASRLPPTVNDEEGWPTYDIPAKSADYHDNKIAFLKGMCGEVSAKPRAKC